MYQLTHTTAIIRLADGASIPADPANSDYADFVLWQEGGNTPLPADPPSKSVPQAVSRAQGKAALIVQGLWPAVQAYVEAIADPTQKALAQVALHDTLTWDRASPFLTAAAAGLGMSSADLDALFAAASEIRL